MNKDEQIACRQRKILELLAGSQGGEAGYSYLAEKLNESGYTIGDRSVRNDCKELFAGGLASKIKKGAAITPKGLDFIKSREVPESRLKEKYLKQIAVLKLLYDSEMLRKNSAKGLTVGQIAGHEGFGSKDTVKDTLYALAGEGLVKQEGDHWRLESVFPRPLKVTGKEARRLYEYLNMVSCLAPLPPDLAMLKSRLVPLMAVPRRDRWLEDLVKVADRIMVHGRGEEPYQEIRQTIARVEEAIVNSRVIDADYRGRHIRIHPLAVVYHWEKRLWYIIAYNPAGKHISQLRADRFSRVEASGELFQRPQGFEPGEHLSIRWGISADAEADVIIRFDNTSRHRTALDKLRGDVSRRQLYCRDCRLIEEAPGGPVLLRDRMSGMSEVAAWIRSYGDAAEVLEPRSLRMKMARTARLMLDRYRVGGGRREQ